MADDLAVQAGAEALRERGLNPYGLDGWDCNGLARAVIDAATETMGREWRVVCADGMPHDASFIRESADAAKWDRDQRLGVNACGPHRIESRRVGEWEPAPLISQER